MALVAAVLPALALAWSRGGGALAHGAARAQAVSSSPALRELAMSAAPQPPPLKDARRLLVSFKDANTRAAAGCKAALAAGCRRVSVDIPQISSVDRSTTARKFEDDNNFLLELIGRLGGPRSPEPVGREILIREGGFEGGGDYLSEEGLYGYRWTTGGSTITAVANSEIDSSALRELKQLDDGRSPLLLFNCALDRLSFFDKLGMPSFDDVEVGYLLRRVGPGFVSRTYPGEYCAWRVESSGKLALAATSPTPFKAADAERAIKG